MNTILDTTPSIQGAQPPKQPRRALILLAVLSLLAFGLILLPRPSLYYPHIVVDVRNGIQLDFWLTPRQEQSACQTISNNVANAIVASCQECRTQRLACLKNPSKDITDLFSSEPLPIPSARMANGIVTYTSDQAGIALLSCQESERQAAARGDRSKVTCYPAATPRPRTAFEKNQAEANHTVFTILLGGMGAILASIVAAILITYRHRSSLSPHASALVSHPWIEKFTLVGIDALVLLGTFLAFAWPISDDIQRWSRIDHNTVLGHGIIVAMTLGWFWMLLEHYARRRPFWDELREMLRVLTIMGMVSGAATFVVGLEAGRFNLLTVWLLNLILLPLGRVGTRQILNDLGLWLRPAVIVGTGENAREAWLALRSEHNMGYRLLGFVRTSTNETEVDSIQIGGETFPIIDTPDAGTLLSKAQVVVALESLADESNQALVQHLLSRSNNVHLIPSIRGLPLFGTQLSHFFSHEVLFLTIHNNLSRKGFQWIKRGFDILLALVALLLASPIMAYVAWQIFREDGHPVIFRQPRLAKGGGEFGFMKFRSMAKNADAILEEWRRDNTPEWQEYYSSNFKLKNDPRLLQVGAWIRATSVDELPQLINVLRGEMSLVGPRPLLARELPEYGKSINYYSQARPGITGLWQISGRSQTTFGDRAALDEWYVQNWSLWYDIAILFKTVDVVLNRRGAH